MKIIFLIIIAVLSLVCETYNEQVKMCFCSTIYRPVCGENFEIYNNSCEAKCNNVKVIAEGDCSEYLKKRQYEPRTCLELYQKNPNLKSGVQKITIEGKNVSVYCEMEVYKGGYTFFSSASILDGTAEKIIPLLQDKAEVLLYMMTKDKKTVKYGLLEQLPELKLKDIKFGVVSKTASPICNSVQNVNPSGDKFLCVEFLDNQTMAAHETKVGVSVNGIPSTYPTCFQHYFSYIALFPKKIAKPSNLWFNVPYPFFDRCLSSLKTHPTQTSLPAEFMFFMEIRFGGCGVYSSTDGRPSMQNYVSAAIGFK